MDHYSSFRSEDLLFRPVALSELASVTEAFRDPVIAHWNPRPDIEKGPEQAARRWIAMCADISAPEHAVWGVFRAAETGDTLLGSVSLHGIDQRQATSELGLWIVRRERGRGVATAAVRAACAFGYRELQLHRVEIVHAVGNRAPCRIAQKLGFALEGRLRQSGVYGDGRRHDEHVHGLLRSDPGALGLSTVPIRPG